MSNTDLDALLAAQEPNQDAQEQTERDLEYIKAQQSKAYLAKIRAAADARLDELTPKPTPTPAYGRMTNAEFEAAKREAGV